jgi:hypothetical protein
VQFSSNYFFDENFKRTDNESIFSYMITFRNRSTITFSGLDTYVKLLRPFDPTNTGKAMLPTRTSKIIGTL